MTKNFKLQILSSKRKNSVDLKNNINLHFKVPKLMNFEKKNNCRIVKTYFAF